MLIKSREYCKICPNDGLGWISLATFLQKRNKLTKDISSSEEIVVAYRNYLKIDKSNPLIYVNLAVELEKVNYEQAREIYEEAVFKFPKNEILLLNYSDFLFKNDLSKAKKILYKIVEINDANEKAIQILLIFVKNNQCLMMLKNFILKLLILIKVKLTIFLCLQYT